MQLDQLKEHVTHEWTWLQPFHVQSKHKFQCASSASERLDYGQEQLS